MDFWKALHELNSERERLDKAIATLEGLHGNAAVVATRSRRGRKNMPPDERRVVSERMKRYWADRRANAQNGGNAMAAGV